MSLCPLTRILAPLALAAVVIAGVARAETPAKPEKLVQKVYAVADLVVPIPGMAATAPAAMAGDVAFPIAQCAAKPCCATANSGCCAEKPTAAVPACGAAQCTAPTCEKQLIKLIRSTIAPESWADAGGRGTIDYMPIGMAVVVNQTPEVQEQVAELLDRLRQAQNYQIALEVRMISVGDCLFEQIAGEFGLQPTGLLDCHCVSRFLERIQNDQRSRVVQAPKLTTFSGREATIRAGDEQFFVTGLSLDKSSRQVTGVPGATASTQTLFVPQNQAFWTGLTMTVQPSVTPDRHTVLLKLQAEVSELTDANVPLFPVTALVTPIFEGGAQGQPVPFTQFVQQPTIMKRGITKVLGIPDGQTAVFSAGRGTRTVMDVDYCPVLGHIPFVCELFKTETPRQESDHLIFLVTPRVIVNAEQKACAGKCCDERACGVAPAWRPAPHCAAPAEQAAPAPCAAAAPAACAPEQLPLPAVRPTPVPSCPVAPCVADVQVKTDITVLNLDESYFERPDATAWSDLSPKACERQPRFLSAEEAERFTTTICDNGGEVVCRPKVVAIDGQPAKVMIGGEREFAVGLRMVHCNGKYLPEVQRERRPVGTSLSVTPTVSADRRFVRVALCAECSRVCSHAEAGCKVTAHVTPSDGSAPQKVTLDPPTIDVRHMETAITIPCGRTALIYGCTEKDDVGRARRCAILISSDLLHQPADVVGHAPPMPTPATRCAPEPVVTPAMRVMTAPPMLPVAPPHVVPGPQPQVQLDVALLDVEEAFFGRPEGAAWADLAPKSCAGKALVISPGVADRFCKSARTLKAAQCFAEPKLVTMDGKPATFLSGGYQAIPEVAPTAAGGEVLGARYEPFGAFLTFRPVVCPADAVRLEIECNLSKLNDTKGFNINGTRVAGRDTQQMSSVTEVQPGRTVVLHMGPGETAGTTKMLLVTPSVIHPMVVPMPVALAVMPAPLPVAEEQAVPPPPSVDPKLARLMRRYQEACAEGRTSAAKKLAAKCLEIDPTCFGRD